MGRDPTCKYTPSSGGLNFPYADFAASESGGQSTTTSSPFTPETGLSPIPNPARVSDCASNLAAVLNSANVNCIGSCGFHGLCDDGEKTESPSYKFKDMPERFSSIISGRQPQTERTRAISFARFCASGSSGITWIKSLIPGNFAQSANHCFAGGSWSIPIAPTCRGIITRWSVRFSKRNCSAALFASAAAFWATPSLLFDSERNIVWILLFRIPNQTSPTIPIPTPASVHTDSFKNMAYGGPILAIINSAITEPITITPKRNAKHSHANDALSSVSSSAFIRPFGRYNAGKNPFRNLLIGVVIILLIYGLIFWATGLFAL